MKTAKEMFEELRYELETPKNSDDKIIRYIAKIGYKDNLKVVFDLDYKAFVVLHDTVSDFRGYEEPKYNPALIKFKLLQAINKQVEELGWSE